MAYTPKPIAPPWKGVLDDQPSILAPSSSFASCQGFYIEKQRIRPFVNRLNFPLWPDPFGPEIGERTFLDVLGNNHTVIITATAAYYFVNGVYTLVFSGGNPSLTPAKEEVYQNTLIYTNGTGSPVVIDGSAVSTTISLPNSGTCLFLGKLASRMLYLNLFEPSPPNPGAVHYPRRFRFSQVNNANNFTDFTAGVVDIAEVEDAITGYATQGALGYIYRNRGISTVTPTGGTAPSFYVENYTEGRGVGNFFPYTLAQYGNLTAFASEADIHAFNPLLGPPQPIGGTATRSIYTDLYSTNGTPVGGLFPTYGSGQQGLQYWLAIPITGNTSLVWSFQFDSQTWTRQTYPFNVTCIDLIGVS